MSREEILGPNSGQIISEDFRIGDARTGLDRIRTRLLDLTNRNRLLNFHHSKRATLQIVGVLPDALFQRLTDGESVVFKPVPLPYAEDRPRPSAKEHAEKLGIPRSLSEK